MRKSTLELSENVYDELLRAAQATGMSPEQWIAERVKMENGSTVRREPTDEEIEEANRRLESWIVDLGYATGTDNEGIDADLAREYGNNHEDDPCS